MIENKFNLHDKIKILAMNFEGIVISIWVLDYGIKYEVRYCAEGRIYSEYFYEWELELIKES